MLKRSIFCCDKDDALSIISTSAPNVEYRVENAGIGRSGHPSSGHSSAVAGSQMSQRVARGLS